MALRMILGRFRWNISPMAPRRFLSDQGRDGGGDSDRSNHPKKSTMDKADDRSIDTSDKKSATVNEEDTTNNNDQNKQQQQRLIDVTEYYTQYIKEYEQGGFKDDDPDGLSPTNARWGDGGGESTRRDKLNMPRGRGETSVIDLDELVDFLRAERVRQVCTIRMPKIVGHAPFMVLGTPTSRRHMTAVVEKLRMAYKQKRAVYDPLVPRIEDRANPEWRVMDIGNAMVHLMMPTTRQKYDIETLWAVGSDHDELTNQTGELDEYTDRLKRLQDEMDQLNSTNTGDRDDKEKTAG